MSINLKKPIANWADIHFRHCQFWSLDDVAMMQQALALAKQGAAAGEIPVGALLVHDGQIIGQGYNCPIGTHNPTAHAEIVALQDACARLNNYRLPKDTALYVTLEPCTMCFGALIHARVTRVIYGASEPKSGAVGSRLSLHQLDFYNHHIAVQNGLLACECSQILSNFFKQRRKDKRSEKLAKS